MVPILPGRLAGNRLRVTGGPAVTASAGYEMVGRGGRGCAEGM